MRFTTQILRKHLGQLPAAGAIVLCVLAVFLCITAAVVQEAVAQEAVVQENEPANQPPPEYQEPVLIHFDREITGISEQYLYRKLDAAKALGADLLIIQIESPGGEVDATLRMAWHLAGIKWARTVAYIPDYALSGGAILALGCDDIIMGPNAQIGDAGVIDERLGKYQYVPEKALGPFIEDVRKLAKEKGRPPGLAEAMVNMDVVLWKVKNKGTGKVTVMTEKEIESEENPDQWEKIQKVHQSLPGKFLTVDGETAVELQLAQAVVPDKEQLKQYYGIEGSMPEFRWTWVDRTVLILNTRLVTILLFVVGIIALYVEFSMPGIGVGGITAVLCFALFFWSHVLGGTAGWLEIVLFAAGLMFLAVELFVIPGFGVAGLTGILLLLASIVMASQGFIIPESQAQWTQMTQNLLVVTISGVICTVVIVYLSSHMGTLPVFNRLVLKPPGAGDQPQAGGDSASGVDEGGEVEIQVGDQGIAESALRPAGKVRFGKQYVDVVTDGDFITRNARVEVLEIVGNRVVVREIG